MTTRTMLSASSPAAIALLLIGTTSAAQERGPAAAVGSTTVLTTCTSSFDDVADDSTFCPAINQVSSLGIMPGCGEAGGDPYFCPGEYVMREDMAVYLEKLYRGASYTPGTPTTDPFNDVTKTYLLAGWMTVLSCDGVTAGCGGGNYCPNGFVSRWEMSVFLSRVIAGRLGEAIPTYGYAQGQWFNCTSQAQEGRPASVSLFSDVPWSDGGCPFIHYIYAKGVTSGCGTNPLIFCPGSKVPRDQMAAFVYSSYNTIGSAPWPPTPCL